jgi:hypothetical protein
VSLVLTDRLVVFIFSKGLYFGDSETQSLNRMHGLLHDTFERQLSVIVTCYFDIHNPGISIVANKPKNLDLKPYNVW